MFEIRNHDCLCRQYLPRIVINRYEFCERARIYSHSVDHDNAFVKILSFDDGTDARPLVVYMQNLICTALGVRIRYPMGHVSMQRMLKLHSKIGQRLRFLLLFIFINREYIVSYCLLKLCQT